MKCILFVTSTLSLNHNYCYWWMFAETNSKKCTIKPYIKLCISVFQTIYINAYLYIIIYILIIIAPMVSVGRWHLSSIKDSVHLSTYSMDCWHWYARSWSSKSKAILKIKSIILLYLKITILRSPFPPYSWSSRSFSDDQLYIVINRTEIQSISGFKCCLIRQIFISRSKNHWCHYYYFLFDFWKSSLVKTQVLG